jgi:hypothetical protein
MLKLLHAFSPCFLSFPSHLRRSLCHLNLRLRVLSQTHTHTHTHTAIHTNNSNKKGSTINVGQNGVLKNSRLFFFSLPFGVSAVLHIFALFAALFSLSFLDPEQLRSVNILGHCNLPQPSADHSLLSFFFFLH